MREVARSLGPQALRWRVLWLFGDGTRGQGVTVAHTYRRPGVYRVDAQADFLGPSGLSSWHDFDAVDVVVGRVPTDVTWLRAALSPSATAGVGRTAMVAPRTTPTPHPTGVAG